VQQNAQLAHLALLGQRLGHGRHHLGAAIGVGGVDVEEARAASERLDVGDDTLGVGQRRAPVEVNAEDVQARAGQRAGGGGAEARRCAEHEGPPVQANGNGGGGHASLRILA